MKSLSDKKEVDDKYASDIYEQENDDMRKLVGQTPNSRSTSSITQ